jgi:hypothetical protein
MFGSGKPAGFLGRPTGRCGSVPTACRAGQRRPDACREQPGNVATHFATELGSMRWDENGQGAISGAEKPDNPRRFGTSRYAPRRPQPNLETGALNRSAASSCIRTGLCRKPTHAPTRFLPAEALSLGDSPSRLDEPELRHGRADDLATGRDGRGAARSCACRSGRGSAAIGRSGLQ